MVANIFSQFIGWIINELECNKNNTITCAPSEDSDQLGERSGSMVECLTPDREAAGSRLTGVIALWSLSKTHLS